jgi:hypothetical protein
MGRALADELGTREAEVVACTGSLQLIAMVSTDGEI